MITCSFLGHSYAYDINMARRAEEAILELARREDEITFLFPIRQNIPFYLACWEGICKAKKYFPEKKLLVHLIVRTNEKESVIARVKERGLPIDQVIAPIEEGVPEGGSHFVETNRKKVQWMIRQSTDMICYLYPELDTTKNSFYRYAQKQKIRIIQIAQEDMKARIAEETKKLSEQEQFALEQKRLGKTQKEIAQITGLSITKARQTLNEAEWKIQRAISQNPNKE